MHRTGAGDVGRFDNRGLLGQYSVAFSTWRKSVRRSKPLLVLLMFSASLVPLRAQSQRWPEAKAEAWYQQQPWLVGSNFTPADAINQLEMWQAASFDPQEID